MATIELTTANFDDVASADGIVFVDFWADWCGPCKRFAPVFEQASERHQDIVFGKVDTEAQPELAGAFGISSIPTLMAIRDSVVLYAQPGALPEQAFEDLISQVREVDMHEVHRQIADESASANGEGAVSQ